MGVEQPTLWNNPFGWLKLEARSSYHGAAKTETMRLPKNSLRGLYHQPVGALRQAGLVQRACAEEVSPRRLCVVSCFKSSALS